MLVRSPRSHARGARRNSNKRARRLKLESLEARQMLDAAGGDDTAGMAYSRFESEEALSHFLLDDALKQYESLFGQPTWGGWGPWVYMMDGPVVADAAGGVTRDHSTTNTQVAGVDEADIIETDGEFLYVLGEGELVIIDATPADGMSVVSRVAIEGQAIGQFLAGDRLAVLSYLQPDYQVSPMLDVAIRPGIWPGPSGPPQLQLTLIDVTNRAAPSVVTETTVDGSFVDARAIGDELYLISSDTLGLPAPEYTCTPIEDPENPDPKDPAGGNGGIAGDMMIAPIWWWPRENCVYETKESYLARVVGREIELGTPQMTSDPGGDSDSALSITATANGGTAGGTTGSGTTGGTLGGGTGSTANDAPSITGPLTQATNIYRPPSADQRNLISITTFNMSSNIPGTVASTAVPTTTTAEVYASTTSIYLANPDWGTRWDVGPATSLIKFDFGDNGSVNLSATGHVSGQTLNQFSIDEHEGYLRIATTQGWGMQSQNAIYVLAQSGEKLEIVGSIVGLAPGERIFSARFMGDEGYVVTFRQVDPLFTLDLSDPTDPEVVGELKIPGFSNYLQAADERYMIGIGRNADLNGRVQELQVSLFDVADMSNPWQAGVYGIDVGDWSWSEATTDHHAVGFYPGYDVLAIPVTNGGGWEWIDRDGDGTREFYTYRPRTDLWVFHLNLDPNIDLAPISLLGRVQHDGHIRRSVRIADVLYAVSENTVSAHPIQDPSTTIAKVHFGQEPVGVPIMTTPVNDPVITMATQSPQVAAPLVLSANAGGSNWSPAVISYLETNGLGESSSSGGGEGTTDSPTLGWNNVNEIKLTFSEDVAVGQNDLTVTGENVEQYPINGFAYDADSRTAVWQLGQSLQADHVTVTLLDSVTDMSGSRLDGDRNGTPGGHFKFSFSSLPGDVNADGVVDTSDVYETMAGAFNFVGSEGFNLAADVDGDGRVTFRDAIAVRNRMGTSLVPSGAPAALVVPAPNSDGEAGSRRSRRGERPQSEQSQPTEEAESTPHERSRRVQRDRTLTPSAVDQALEDGSATQETQSTSGRAAARRSGR